MKTKNQRSHSMDLNSNTIVEIPGLMVDNSICDRVIKYFEKTKQRSWWQDLEFFRGRTLCPYEIKDSDLKKDLKAFHYRLIQEAYKLYNEFVFLEFWDIVYWAPGMSMLAHVDDYGPDLQQRHYTAVCYLNDDYEGGETFFPEQNYKCKPDKGKTVIFPSYYYHGVNEVKLNSRYVLVLWFTRNPKELFVELTIWEKMFNMIGKIKEKWRFKS